ncbi:MAG TPA: ATP-dependent helicase HrpB [Xanthobacteraceae bacterium]|nr:ATP-dependent helicase HrpB [Xanthobacteraceae bacterium]
MTFDQSLPIDAVLPALTAALAARNVAVLVAPPGAGKSTRVPLVLAQEPWARGRKIIVLEPRRLAARAAATRMATTLREQVGETVGYRVRFGSKISRATRIEVVTEGVFTRRVLDDPGLEGVAALLFDEFHERSLDADLGLALARDVQTGLREDLRLVIMSATLDAAHIARLLDGAPVIESSGRAFAVDTRYLGRDARAPVERQVVDAILQSIRDDSGSVLAFLPGAAEIRRAETQLRERIADPSVDVVALYGALEAQAQDRAIAPAPPGRRKIVLATSIAETSLTIEGVRIVVDCGLARVPRYEPDVGLTRLETVRVSRAAADQRRGRAGRTEPGICYRLWEAPQTASLEAANRPEILAADLSGFMLDLAHWGVHDPATLAFLDPPPAAAAAEAKALLSELGAVDAQGRITPVGKQLRQLPLPPRLARMVVDAGAAGEALLAADIAVVLTERGLGGNDVDLTHRLDGLRRDRSPRAGEARAMAKRWAEMTRANATLSSGGPNAGSSCGALLGLAYPDRIAKNRGGEAGFLLANGRGARLDAGSPLAREPFLAVAEIAGTAAQGRIVLAAPLSLAEIEAGQAGRIETREDIVFDAATASLRARRVRRLDALTLNEQPMTIVPSPESARILAHGIGRLGIERLPWSKALRQWRDRVMFLRRAEGQESHDEWPDLSDAALAGATDWLIGLADGKRALAEVTSEQLADALAALLPWNLRRRLEVEAPTHFAAPSGSSVPIDYDTEVGPTLAIRVQELFGLDRHPTVAGGRAPLVIELLSPAHRPVQVTRDLPGFWRGSYASVKAEMKGRYPRHPWPDDPLAAPPTRRAKPRGQ